MTEKITDKQGRKGVYHDLELRLARADKINATQKCEINLLWGIFNTMLAKERFEERK
jgi:hypothetical protein